MIVDIEIMANLENFEIMKAIFEKSLEREKS